ALTDATGRYVLTDIPDGTHELVASYLGLDPARGTVTVSGAAATTRSFDLTTAIYRLDTFTVTGEREGNAAALTAQRNAPNVKNVVALDAHGNLPNMNASELAVLLPGVAGNLSDEGNIVGFTIRGMGPGSNTITVDGALLGSQGGDSRQTRIHTMTGSMFEALEVTKGHTPDKEAGSLGGTVNLKSRSPLGMKEQRRITYNFSARIAPPGTQQVPLREQHRTHPLLNVAWQEVFSVLGGERNLGMALNLFYSEQAVGFFSTSRDFQNTTTAPAYLWDFRTQDNYNNRKQSSLNLKFDYRLSESTKLSLNYIFNDAFERFRLRYYFRAFTGNQNTVPGPASGVIPGYTDRRCSRRCPISSTASATSTSARSTASARLSWTTTAWSASTASVAARVTAAISPSRRRAWAGSSTARGPTSTRGSSRPADRTSRTPPAIGQPPTSLTTTSPSTRSGSCAATPACASPG
ncbi:MAG: hypothetical protein RL479_2420, partial [Verrucomicrobiota bacterium]